MTKSYRSWLGGLLCKIGLHSPPHDMAYSSMGAIFAGGPCTRCNDPTIREWAFIGNAWDFPDGIVEECDNAIFLQCPPAESIADLLAKRGITYTGSLD